MEHRSDASSHDQVSELMSALAPGPADRPDAARALRQFNAHIEQQPEGAITMFGFRLNRRMQQITAVLGVIVVLAGLLAVPQVRALASNFLSIFRVEKFVLVNVDQQRIEQIQQAMKDNMGFTEKDVTPAVEAKKVGSVAEAAALAGFQPLTTDQYGAVAEVEVSSASQRVITPNVAEIRKVYQALNLDPSLIPDNIDGKPFDVSIKQGIAIKYAGNGDAGAIQFGQIPSPEVNVPDGVDMKQLGKAMLMLLGMNEQQATSMSDSIDWATTLVVPIPTGTTDVQEVTVRGTKGLLYNDGGDAKGSDGSGGATVVWQENGYVMVVHGASPTAVVTFAENLK